jgi:hypothetical protein
VKNSDAVLSADPETGKQSYQKVVRTFVLKADGLLRIETEDGCSIEATPEHPFWVETKGFVAAKKLARSDLLRDAKGDRPGWRTSPAGGVSSRSTTSRLRRPILTTRAIGGLVRHYVVECATGP